MSNLFSNPNIGSPHFKHWSNKNETMHSNSDGTTGFHGKMSFINNFGKSVVLI